ncbi:hypothetical protein [Halomonas sp. CKK8]|uniref:hypothetical protein n=1 Tax=Halomonas sp. CKK8 TaxID=3036127 RepID=UPI0024155ED5|nr:hypothetical protein [Halomonas sp. CKK8]WFM72377.1 hypothetical protein P8934_05065 [Halomonas sp. CKK8]
MPLSWLSKARVSRLCHMEHTTQALPAEAALLMFGVGLPTVAVDNHRENRWKATGSRHANRPLPLPVTF